MRWEFIRVALAVLSISALCGLIDPQAHAQSDLAGAGLGKEFVSETANVNGATIHYVRGGKGPTVVLVHGFPQDWFEYHAIMPSLAKQFTVIAVDLRGVGGSKVMSGSYDAANMAEDIRQLLATLKLERVFIVGHDVGGMVTYAFVRRFPEITRGAMILDVPLPGIDGWDESQSSPGLWHIGFMQVPNLPERLVTGRQAAYFDYFFDFGKFTPDDRAHYVKAYAAPEALHSMFEMYRAFPANAQFNKSQRSANNVPLFYAAGEKSPFVALVPKIVAGMRAAGMKRVESGSIPGSVHYVVQDQPEKVGELILRHAVQHSQ